MIVRIDDSTCFIVGIGRTAHGESCTWLILRVYYNADEEAFRRSVRTSSVLMYVFNKENIQGYVGPRMELLRRLRTKISVICDGLSCNWSTISHKSNGNLNDG